MFWYRYNGGLFPCVGNKTGVRELLKESGHDVPQLSGTFPKHSAFELVRARGFVWVYSGQDGTTFPFSTVTSVCEELGLLGFQYSCGCELLNLL